LDILQFREGNGRIWGYALRAWGFAFDAMPPQVDLTSRGAKQRVRGVEGSRYQGGGQKAKDFVGLRPSGFDPTRKGSKPVEPEYRISNRDCRMSKEGIQALYKRIERSESTLLQL